MRGNTSDKTTLADMLKKVTGRCGKPEKDYYLRLDQLGFTLCPPAPRLSWQCWHRLIRC
jgi:hypothetical protein